MADPHRPPVRALVRTAAGIAEARTILLVRFAPLRPAAFVLLRVVLQRDPTRAAC